MDNETLAADVRAAAAAGPCGVGEKALYLNSFFIDRHYYVALGVGAPCVKRVAMSKGGFTGRAPSIPYLVVGMTTARRSSATSSTRRMWTICWAYLAKICPDLPLQSQKVERHMAQQQAQEARRYLRS